ncbi:MAG TPA: hypothetical protein VGZ69_04515 [Candidatus Rhabdochlamydia sp.]|jgi:hypothetical protein|nr:hypothetical protein [Candidatus Rhabdochlamydia sp.]
METPPKQVPETFSVEQAYVIGMLFFLNLWPLVEPRVIEEEQKLGTYSLFFVEVCSGDECYAEWNEAIRRVLYIPKEEQRLLQLSLSEIFLCTLEFCKLHNERYESRIAYAVHLLESMKKDPKSYKTEWAVWQDVVEQTVNKYMNSNEFDWSDELPTWPNQKTDASIGDNS